MKHLKQKKKQVLFIYLFFARALTAIDKAIHIGDAKLESKRIILKRNDNMNTLKEWVVIKTHLGRRGYLV